MVLREREEEKAKLAKLLKEMHSKVQEVLGKSNWNVLGEEEVILRASQELSINGKIVN